MVRKVGTGMKGMTRGELAKQIGISMATIRYYEDSGILPAPDRAVNGYRIYTDDYLIKLRLIKDAKSIGFSLKEIQEVLQMLNNKIEAEELKELVRNKILEIDERITSLHAMQSMLAGLLETPKDEIHDFMRSFNNADG